MQRTRSAPGAQSSARDLLPFTWFEPGARHRVVRHGPDDADWQKAAQVSYAALANDTALPINQVWIAYALRMDARRSGDCRRALATLERMCKATWSASGVPTLPTQMDLASYSVALGDLLIASGDRTRGERLLRVSLADMIYIEHDLKRGDLWYAGDQAIALALLGDRKGSLAVLHRASDEGYIAGMWILEADPAFDAMRADPEFLGIVRAIEQKRTSERRVMDQLRAEGKLPYRGQSAPNGVAPPQKATAAP
jgi:hypothetical protein